jgi:hypothetical protein
MCGTGNQKATLAPGLRKFGFCFEEKASVDNNKIFSQFSGRSQNIGLVKFPDILFNHYRTLLVNLPFM